MATVTDVLQFSSHPQQGSNVQCAFPGKTLGRAVNERLGDFESEFVALVLQFEKLLDQRTFAFLGVFEYVDEPFEHVAGHGGKSIDLRLDQGKIQLACLGQQTRTLIVNRGETSRHRFLPIRRSRIHQFLGQPPQMRREPDQKTDIAEIKEGMKQR